MSEQHYSNDKIDGMFLEIKTILKDQNKTLERIETQTVKTNGRVTKLESWRSYGSGAVAIIFIIVIPLIVYIFNSRIEMIDQQQSITKIHE